PDAPRARDRRAGPRDARAAARAPGPDAPRRAPELRGDAARLDGVSRAEHARLRPRVADFHDADRRGSLADRVCHVRRRASLLSPPRRPRAPGDAALPPALEGGLAGHAR